MSRATMRQECWAGLTVGLMLVPQGIAYAHLAGMPPVTGIYASLLPALIAVLWSSSTRLGVGPTALTSLLVGASLTGLAAPGSAQWVAMAAWLALLSGGLQLAMGVGRCGWLLNLVSSPVMAGFTQAAAWLIVASQVGPLLGTALPLSEWMDTARLAQTLHAPSVAFGLGSLAVLVAGRRWAPRFPAAIVLVAASAGLSQATSFAASGGAVVGRLPTGLPAPYWPGALPWADFSALLLPALMVTLISFLETAASARIEARQGSTRLDENQDLIGQGLAKIASGLCGAFPTSASFSRSAINLYAGARTGWATVFSIGVVLAVLLWLAPLLQQVPQAVLAAIVVVAVTSLIRPGELVKVAKVSCVEGTTAAATFVLTLWTSPRMYGGVLAGLLLSMAHNLYQRLHPRIIEVGEHADGSLRDRALWHLPPLAQGVYALRMDADVDFASARVLERHIADRVAAQPDLRHVCLFAQPINRIDATGVEALTGVRELLRERGLGLHVSGLKLPAEQALRQAGWFDDAEGLWVYRSEAETLQQLRNLSPAASPGLSGGVQPELA